MESWSEDRSDDMAETISDGDGKGLEEGGMEGGEDGEGVLSNQTSFAPFSRSLRVCTGIGSPMPT